MGLAVGLAVGLGVAVGFTVGLAVGLGVEVAFGAVGLGVDVALGASVVFGASVALGASVAFASGALVGSGDEATVIAASSEDPVVSGPVCVISDSLPSGAEVSISEPHGTELIWSALLSSSVAMFSSS